MNARQLLKLIGEEDPRRHRIQKRTVTETPWEDIADV